MLYLFSICSNTIYSKSKLSRQLVKWTEFYLARLLMNHCTGLLNRTYYSGTGSEPVPSAVYVRQIPFWSYPVQVFRKPVQKNEHIQTKFFFEEHISTSPWQHSWYSPLPAKCRNTNCETPFSYQYFHHCTFSSRHLHIPVLQPWFYPYILCLFEPVDLK